MCFVLNRSAWLHVHFISITSFFLKDIKVKQSFMDRNTVKLKSGYLRVGGIYTTCSYAVSFKPCKIIPHEWYRRKIATEVWLKIYPRI